MSEDLRKKKSESLLKLALEEQLEQDEEMLKYSENSERENIHVFSKEHEEKMKKIFKMADKVERKAKYKQKYRQLVAGVVIFLCFSTVTVTNVEAFKLPIIQFFKEVQEKYTLFGVKGEESQIVSEQFQQYVPTYVPEDYVIVEVEEDVKRFCIKYENSKDNSVYIYYYWDEMNVAVVDTEEGIVQEINIYGNSAYVVEKKNEIKININKGTQRFYLNGRVSYEDAIKIMESIEGIK